MSAPVGSSTSGDHVHDTDWRRLHSRVLPNPLTLDAFKACLVNGTVQDTYRATDLHKIAQEMRDILREHGELREAACFPVKGKKGELGRAMAAAICVLRRDHPDRAAPQGSADPASLETTAPLSRRPRDGGVAGGADGGMPVETPSPPVSPDDHTAEAPHEGRNPNDSTRHRQAGRHLPITDHIEALSALEGTSTSTLPPRTHPLTNPGLAHAGKVGSGKTATPAIASPPEDAGSARLSLRIARNASQPHTPDLNHLSPPSAASPDTHASRPTDVGHAERGSAQPPARASAAPLPPSAATGAVVTETVSTGVTNELNALNEYGSPFFQILNVVRRFQLRYGTHQLRFDLPAQYAQAVATRRLRVLIIPFRHPNLPSRWPTAKEIVVYVNDQCVTIPWKRTWPERKEEVAKSFLPLDVTQMLLSRSGASTTQRLQVDVFTSDYFAPALLVVAQPFSLEEVLEQTLYDVAGATTVEAVESHLLALLDRYESTSASTFDASPSASSPSTSAFPAPLKLAASMNGTLGFYRSIMEEDVDDGIEVDDPIITTKCPISQLPLQIPIRGVHCRHLQCVDLASYLMSCAKGCYWNCALCDCPLRPREARIDTVLWSFLCQARARGGDSMPHYLRLSVREALTQANSVARHHYHWHVSRPHGADADVLVDTSDEEEDSGAATGEAALAPRPPTPTSAPESRVEAVGQKRSRSPPALTEGTMDNPIEL